VGLAVVACGGIPDSEIALFNAPNDAGSHGDLGVADVGVDTGVVADSGAPIDAHVADSTSPDAAVVVDSTPQPADTFVPPPDVPVGVACPEPGAIRYGGHCYFPTDALAFNDAFNACKAAQPPAHLVAISSDAEQTAVEALQTGTQRWIGLTRDPSAPSDPSSFQWLTGEPMTYQHWHNDPTDVEPNGSGPCVRFLEDGTWADWTCDSPLVSICERE
jgi:hypothetical protein